MNRFLVTLLATVGCLQAECSVEMRTHMREKLGKMLWLVPRLT